MSGTKFTLGVIGSVIIGLAVLVSSQAMVYAILSSAPQENSTRLMDTVKVVCDYARGTINGESEEACGKAQDKSDTEYLCQSITVPNAHCWVEDHHYDAIG